jgi:photosystem II stability/assembly factor-like uncharacterized protein
VLSTQVWTDISPSGVRFKGGGNFTQGMTIDTCNPNTLYVAVVGFDLDAQPYNGLYRSRDGGTSWTRTGPMTNPIRVRVNPNNSNHIYAVDGVTGNTNGFWVTTDGGEHWEVPESFKALVNSQGIIYDSYHVETNPANFNHILITFHNGWSAPKWGGNSGIIESKDAGQSWIVHNPPNTRWAGGYNIFFLYDPERGIGDERTWLFGTQAEGYWRTEDAGESWTQVSTVDMDHGGGSIYYGSDNTLYVSGAPHVLRSKDNGKTFEPLTPTSFSYFLTIIGDGTRLYTANHHGGRMRSALESTDTAWSDLGGDDPWFTSAGPFEMQFDKTNRIMYSAHTGAGVFARKIPD